MSHGLTRWIEDADARRFGEAVMLDRGANARDHRQPCFGEMIAKMPSWLHALTHVCDSPFRARR